MKCRHCAAPLTERFIDLGFAPPSNAYLTQDALSAPEAYYPLRVAVCGACWLVQTEDYKQADELFTGDYAYFSSTSKGWLAHAATYASDISARLALGRDSLVVEVASNDGYLLKNFVGAGIPCYGIEPTTKTAQAARGLGIDVVEAFFGEALAQRLIEERGRADLIAGNNVYAHVPDINDFTRGLKALLKPSGTITLEFPHLAELIEHCQFDTIYHEHFSYLSLGTVARLFEAAGLRVFDVDRLPTHGGSLRIYGCHAQDPRATSAAVESMRRFEAAAGLESIDAYRAFQQRAEAIKNGLLDFLLAQKKAGKTVAAYGAAAKGNTLLNFAGLKTDLISFVCDAAPSKQGRYMPGSHLPIVAPDTLLEHKPDFVLLLPWNLKSELATQLSHVKQWGGRLVTAVPTISFVD